MGERMRVRYILGADPGIHGAIALLGTRGSLEIFDMPTIRADKKLHVDDYTLARKIDAFGKNYIETAFIERVHAMPKNGAVSMFSFGTSYGILRGVIAASFIPAVLVTPQSWKKDLGITSDKKQSLAKARELFPEYLHLFSRQKDDGRAEAALLAYYGLSHGVNA